MNKVLEKLVQKVLSKQMKYFIILSMLTTYFIIGVILNASLTSLSLTTIGILIGFLVIDIIQYFIKQEKR